MDKALLARVEKQALFHRYPRSLPLTLLGLGILITVLFAVNVERADSEARKLALEGDAAMIGTTIERKANENIAYLKAAAALFSTADDITSDEFTQFVAEMSVDHSNRGSLGMGWAQWIKGSEVTAYEERQILIDPMLPYKVHPAPISADADLAVISLIEPKTEANKRAFGFDMYSEPVRRKAMQESMRLGRPVASGTVRLMQDVNTGIAGILIYLPVYERVAPPQIQGRLKGFIYTPVRVQNLLDTAIISAHRNTGRVALYEGTPSADSLLAATQGAFDETASASRPVEFAGRKWTVVVSGYYAGGLSSTSMLVLIFGTLISLLAMALAWLVTSRAADDRKVLEWLTRQAALRTSLTRELNHRVKNTLANVLSIVSLTRRRASSLDEFAEGLVGRIRALSATHDLLSQREWTNALVLDVVTSELAPYLDPQDPHAEVSGPEALLAPNEAMSLGLALHELSTNAAKYGALSVPDGRVSVTWELLGVDRCAVLWCEQGGPPVKAPTRRGFGLELIEKIVSHELSAPVELEFRSEGVRCRIVVPLREAREFTIREGSPNG